MRKKLLMLFAVLMSFILTIPTVYGAFSYHTVTTSGLNPYESQFNCILYHSSGKFIYANYDRTDEDITWWIYDTTGTLVSTNTHSLSYTTKNIFNEFHMKIVELDSDEIAIVYVQSYTDTYNQYMWIVKINIISYSVWSGGLSVSTESEDQSPSCIGFAQHDDLNYFIYHNVHLVYTDEAIMYVVEYNHTDNTRVKRMSASLGTYGGDENGGRLEVVQHPNNTKDIYVVTSLDGDITTPKYYAIDLESFTMELLATHPYNTRWSGNHSDEEYKLAYLGGGVHISGTDTYLYYTWIYASRTASLRWYYAIQHRLRFNQTIEASELEAQNERRSVITPSQDGDTEVLWTLGYMTNRTYFRMYMPYMSGSHPYNVGYFDITVSDWYNFATSSLSTSAFVDDQDDVIPLGFTPNGEDDFVGRDLTGAFSVHLTQDYDTSTRIYYDLDILFIEYDIILELTTSIGGSPLDISDPLDTYTTYYYNFYTYANDRLSSEYGAISINDIQIWAGETDETGYKRISYTRTVSGIIDWNFEIYQSGIEQYQEIYQVSYSETDQEYPTPETFGVTTLLGITSILPVLVLLFVPSGALMIMSPSGKPLMFMIGLMVGGILCVMSGLLPSYFIFFLLLGVVIMFVFMLKQR